MESQPQNTEFDYDSVSLKFNFYTPVLKKANKKKNGLYYGMSLSVHLILQIRFVHLCFGG